VIQERRGEPGTDAAEFFYIDEKGLKQDVALHADMLDNKAADEKQRRRAIQNQLEVGLSREDVEAIFGPISPPSSDLAASET
jgi:hypothetical protein